MDDVEFIRRSKSKAAIDNYLFRRHPASSRKARDFARDYLKQYYARRFCQLDLFDGPGPAAR